MSIAKYIVSFALGGSLATGAFYFINGAHDGQDSASVANAAEDTKQPLYWVAPMDPNYRRDKPGKSPMGMDLIPFYGDDQAASSPGTITIAPEVINNLGVRTVTAQQGVLKQDISTVGYLGYNADTVVHLHSRVDGWIEKSFIKSNGDHVKQGDPLFDLYSPELVNAQEELVFALNRQDARLLKAAEERLRSLQVPSRFVEQLKKTRKVSQSVRFFASQDGVVDNLGIRDGFYVTPGVTLMSIADLSELWLEAEVFERQAHLVEVGQEIEAFTDFMPGRSFVSKVDFIYPTIDATTRTVKVRVRLDNTQEQLKPNMFAHLRIHAQSHATSLLIPKEALIRGGQQDRVVLALGDGKFKSIAVKVGRFGKDDVEVIDGLQAGDEVVASAHFLLDSESSKTSDFMRMVSADESAMDSAMSAMAGDSVNGSNDHSSMSAESMAEPDSTQKSDTTPKVAAQNVWVEARINRLDAAARKINVNHGAIPEWQWPKMTMDFALAEWVEIDELPVGKPIQLEITRESSTHYLVTDYFDASAQ